MHRSLLLAGALGCACKTLPGGEDVHLIRAHWASSVCAPAGTSRTFDLEALGDFPPSTDTSEELDSRKALVVPGATRAVAMTARAGFTSYLGLGESAVEHADIDVSLWPATAPCALDTPAGDCDYPGTTGAPSAAMGVSSDGRTLVVAGSDDETVAKDALAVDLATGKVTCASGSHGMQLARSGAKVVPLGDKLLVSGGNDPLKDVARGTGEVFDPGSKRFEPELVALNGERARHAAVSLASGEALLVGGVGADKMALDSLEVLDPETHNHRFDVTSLPGVRVDPIAFRLSDDRIFVAGGTDAPGAGSPVPDLLWLTADATSIDRRLEALSCPDDSGGTTTVRSAFTPMPGGAVLAVGGCTLPPPGGSALPCAAHCDGQPRGCLSSEVFWIDRDANVACCGAGRSQCGGTAGSAPAWILPELVPGADGTPWLLEGAPDSRRFHRFDPWTGQFETAAVAAGADPVSLVTADRGLFLWLQQADEASPLAVLGFRHGVRGPFTQTIAPLLLAGGEGIVPAQPPSPTDDASAFGPWRDPSSGAVTLPPGAELVVTDTTYADVDVVIHVVKGPPPLVRIGSAVFGRTPCPWPARSSRAPSFDAEVTRTDGAATLTIAGERSVCGGPSGRASLAIAGSAAPVTIGTIAVTRLAPP